MSIFGGGITDKENLLANFNAGSILFSDGAGGVAEDNDNLFWDDINKRWGLGTPLPTNKFHLSDDSTFTDPLNSLALIENTNNSANAHASLLIRQAGGTSGGNAMSVYDIKNLGGGKIGSDNSLSVNHLIFDVNPLGTAFSAAPEMLITTDKVTINGAIVIPDNSYGSGNPAIDIGSQDGTNEGGEILWRGAGSFDDITQDIFQDKMRFFLSAAATKTLELSNFGSGIFNLKLDGGIEVGSPTGSNKGAGTINAEGVFDDNVLLTDYVFEKYYKGLTKDKKFKDYTIKSLKKEIDYTKKNLHLSTISGREEWEKNGKFSVGHIINQFWQTLETQFLYIAELKQDIDLLKKLN